MRRGRSALVSGFIRACQTAWLDVRLAKDNSLKKNLSASSGLEFYESQSAALRSRRLFLKQAAAAGLAAPLLNAGFARAEAQEERHAYGQDTRIVIVGAGIAGLAAARTLRRAGLQPTIFDASRRGGGRIMSLPDVIHKGIVTEFGGEFIDTSHTDMWDLIKEFKLETLDMEKDSSFEDCYYFSGQMQTFRSLVEGVRPFIEKISADAEACDPDVRAGSGGRAKELDNMSIGEYLDRIGLSGWVRSLIEVAYITEYGLDSGDQSALNLILLIADWTDFDAAQLFGESDERYKVRGGNARITQALMDKYGGEIQFGHALESVQQNAAGYKLSFLVSGSPAREVTCDAVILCIPHTLLRAVKFGIDLPTRVASAIREMGMGMNTKVMLGFSSRPWRKKGLNGNVLADTELQLAWDNGRLQGGAGTGVTFYFGGEAALRAGEGSPLDQAKRLLPLLEQCFKGSAAAHTGTAHRFHWPTYTFSRGSYSCFRPGQWTTLGGNFEDPAGNIYFAGEHCSLEFQGFMNGGAETGRRAAERLLQRLRA